MLSMKKKAAALLVAICMTSTLALAGCQEAADTVEQVVDDAASSVAQLIEGNVTGEVGTEYKTKWFNFTVESMEITDTYDSYTAAEGNLLLVAHISETNISGAEQPFGTFDWFIDDDSLSQYLYPLDPLNDNMMPTSFDLADGESASYDVVIEYPSSLASPFLMYIEVDEQGETYTTFKIPVK